MCGIFGFIGNIATERALQCLNTLTHRGPDGYGLWSQPHITLGHRRLSILDLSENGKQPMSYAEGRYWITFNGEIYNYLEIRSELIAKGHQFHSASDTEVILAAFLEWGEACLDRFNGMWAFAIWDCRDRALFLARDRLGKKPLFYTTLSKGEFAFASEMKALIPLLNEVRANCELIQDTTRIFSYESTTACVIKGISRFPAGHCGWVRNGRLSTRRWWCTLDHLVEVPTRYEEQVEQLRALFFDACRLRMRSDVPIGTALSGGLDSSATLSTMAHLGNSGLIKGMGRSWQHAFVASFPGTPLDEVVYAREAANHVGVNANIIDVNPLNAIDQLDDYFYLFEDLYITSPIPFMQTYNGVKAHGISVTLDGHGADELFGGYSFDYLVALKDTSWNLQEAYKIVGTYYDGLPKNSDQFAKLPPKTIYLLKHYAKHWASKIVRRKVDAKSRDAAHIKWLSLDKLNRQLYVSTHETILPTLLRNYDRYSMANSVEIRMPFLDHRILTFAFSLPWSSKIRGGFSKAIIRDAVSPYMPHEIAYRKTKLGFNSPIVDWMKGPLKDFMMDTIYSESFRNCDLINVEEVTRAVRYVIENPSARFSDGEHAWRLLNPFLWERAFIHNRSKVL